MEISTRPFQSTTFDFFFVGNLVQGACVISLSQGVCYQFIPGGVLSVCARGVLSVYPRGCFISLSQGVCYHFIPGGVLSLYPGGCVINVSHGVCCQFISGGVINLSQGMCYRFIPGGVISAYHRGCIILFVISSLPQWPARWRPRGRHVGCPLCLFHTPCCRGL